MASPNAKTPPSAPASQYPSPEGVGAASTTGADRVIDPAEPWKLVSPIANTPPSAPTSRYPGSGGGSGSGDGSGGGGGAGSTQAPGAPDARGSHPPRRVLAPFSRSTPTRMTPHADASGAAADSTTPVEPGGGPSSPCATKGESSQGTAIVVHASPSQNHASRCIVLSSPNQAPPASNAPRRAGYGLRTVAIDAYARAAGPQPPGSPGPHATLQVSPSKTQVSASGCAPGATPSLPPNRTHSSPSHPSAAPARAAGPHGSAMADPQTCRQDAPSKTQVSSVTAGPPSPRPAPPNMTTRRPLPAMAGSRSVPGPHDSVVHSRVQASPSHRQVSPYPVWPTPITASRPPNRITPPGPLDIPKCTRGPGPQAAGAACPGAPHLALQCEPSHVQVSAKPFPGPSTAPP